VTGVPEKEYAYTLAFFERFGSFTSNRDNSPCWFVRADLRSLRLVEAFVDLIICMTESCCADFD
jgi:hypothetical protein